MAQYSFFRVLYFFTFQNLLLLPPVDSEKLDNTTKEYAVGVEITEAVIQRIINSNIFPDDHFFLMRLAQVESLFGLHPNTFRPNFCGGIWQVDENKFEKTQDLKNLTLHPTLLELHQKVLSYFNINWRTTEWCDLLKPLYSGIAVSIFLYINSVDWDNDHHSLITNPPPITIRRQADYWHRYYRPENSGNTLIFVEKALSFHEKWNRCEAKLDLLVAVDASASFKNPSISFTDLLTKHIHSILDQTFNPSLRYIRIGMFLFSNQPYHIADLENNYSIDKLIALATDALSYFPGGDTRTDLALKYAADVFRNAGEKNKGAPQLILMFTDGQSSPQSNITEAVKVVSNSDINTIVIGIGNETDMDELQQIALGNKRNVYKVTRLDTLPDLFLGLRSVLCGIPQKPLYIGEGYAYTDALKQNQMRYYVLMIENEKGITVVLKIRNTNGTLNAYWSFSDQHPYIAVHDGEIDEDGRTYIPAQGISNSTKPNRATGTAGGENQVMENDFPQKVYFTVEGKKESNIYDVYILEGDQDKVDDSKGAPRLRSGGDRAIFMIYCICLGVVLRNIKVI